MRKSNPWVLVIGVAFMVIMFLVSVSGSVATSTVQLSIKNRVQAVQMQEEVK